MHSFKMCSGAMVTNKVNNLGAEAGGTFELTQQLGSSKPREQQGNAAPGQGGPAAGTGRTGREPRGGFDPRHFQPGPGMCGGPGPSTGDG